MSSELSVLELHSRYNAEYSRCTQWATMPLFRISSKYPMLSVMVPKLHFVMPDNALCNMHLLSLCVLNCAVLFVTANMLHMQSLHISPYFACMQGERTMTARWALDHQAMALFATGSCPPRYTCGQIEKGGHEHEVVGDKQLLDLTLAANWSCAHPNC